MNKEKSAVMSLRASMILNFGFLAFIVFSLCGILFYVSAENHSSIIIQQQVADDYYTANKLDEAIDDLLYYSAELSNSLSDDSYDAFLAASSIADNYIAIIPDPEFKSFLSEKKEIVVQSALNAMDAYVDDDRILGESIMKTMRETVEQIRAPLDQYVLGFEAVRYAEESAIVSRSKIVERVTILIAAIATLTLGGIFAFIYTKMFVPIENLISRLSLAAQDSQNAKNYVQVDLSNNEIGKAGRALNHLLISVDAALEEVQRRAAESAKTEKRWQALFRDSPDAIIMLNPTSTKVLEKNPATDKLLCLNADSFQDELKATDFHPHQSQELLQFFADVLEEGYARSDLLSCAIEDRTIPVSVVGVAVPHDNDRAILLHIRNMSAQKAHEEGLEKARIAAEHSNQVKANFLANMSHEIRTPMNGVIGMTDVLLTTPLDKNQKDLLSIVRSSGQSLLTVINDILDYSKLEGGKLCIHPNNFDLRATVFDVIQLLNAQAMAKGIKLNAIYTVETPSWVIGDEGRVRQILNNLVANAVKFTDTGEVAVHVTGTIVGNTVTIHTEVIDTGIGIESCDACRIFERFEQADGSRTRNFEGSGLGLSICKEVVELMGGEIGVESQINTGSIFWFDLSFPIGTATGTSDIASANDESPLDRLKVLAIEQKDLGRASITNHLKAAYLQYELVSSYADATYELHNASQLDDPYHVVLIDMRDQSVEDTELANFIWHNQKRASLSIMLMKEGHSIGEEDNTIGPNAYWIARPKSKNDIIHFLTDFLKSKSDEHGSNSVRESANG